MYKHRLSKKEKTGALYFLIFVAVFFVALYGYKCTSTKVCQTFFLESVVRHDEQIKLPNGTVSVEVVDTTASREQGLSGRKGLGSNEGMLFAFDLPGRYGFWMKDMLFPIDMIWFNENGVVVNVVENVKPEDFPATYINQAPASYVLEIGANKAREYGVFLGSKVVIKK
jgi:uncharacterized membrane protein (UPF0127 family)